jgi:hypothetical protein
MLAAALMLKSARSKKRLRQPGKLGCSKLGTAPDINAPIRRTYPAAHKRNHPVRPRAATDHLRAYAKHAPAAWMRNANPLHPGGLVKIFAFDGCFLREKPNK